MCFVKFYRWTNEDCRDVRSSFMNGCPSNWAEMSQSINDEVLMSRQQSALTTQATSHLKVRNKSWYKQTKKFMNDVKKYHPLTFLCMSLITDHKWVEESWTAVNYSLRICDVKNRFAGRMNQATLLKVLFGSLQEWYGGQIECCVFLWVFFATRAYPYSNVRISTVYSYFPWVL